MPAGGLREARRRPVPRRRKAYCLVNGGTRLKKLVRVGSVGWCGEHGKEGGPWWNKRKMEVWGAPECVNPFLAL